MHLMTQFTRAQQKIAEKIAEKIAIVICLNEIA